MPFEDSKNWNFEIHFTCSFTRVMDIRQKKITAEMSAKEKTALQKAKKIFTIQPPEEEITPELQDELDDFMKRHRK